MNTLILKVAARFLITVILLYSFFLFLRGHHYPGGGFIGGLAAAASWSLLGIAYDRNVLRKSLPFDPMKVATFGLLIALTSALFGPAYDHALLTSWWTSIPLGGHRDSLKIGTPLFFDFGIYLIIFGTVVNVVMNLEERE